MSNSIKETAAALKEGKRFLLTGHSMPDGDSMGSVLALGLALRALGYETTMVSDGAIPACYRFLPGSTDFINFSQVQADYDTVVFLDCTDPTRSGPGIQPLIEGRRIINIDHHVSNSYFGEINLVNPQAAAAGEIVYLLIEELGLEFNKEIAICLYTALIMDTGSFQFSNTTSQTHQMAARLIETGIDITWINRNLYDNQPLIKVKLLQKALATLNLSSAGKIAWAGLTARDLEELGAQHEHVEGIIGYVKMIEGVEIGLLFHEIAPGLIKVGFRSKEEADVNELAGRFGGGGHPKAAGCKIQGQFEEVIKKVVQAARETIGEEN